MADLQTKSQNNPRATVRNNKVTSLLQQCRGLRVVGIDVEDRPVVDFTGHFGAHFDSGSREELGWDCPVSVDKL